MSAAIELVDPFTNIAAETNRWQSNSSDRYHSISDIDWCTSDCKRIFHWPGDVDYMYKSFTGKGSNTRAFFANPFSIVPFVLLLLVLNKIILVIPLYMTAKQKLPLKRKSIS